MLLYDFALLVGVKWVKLRELELSPEELTSDKYAELARNILERATLHPDTRTRYSERLQRLANLPALADPKLRLARKTLGMTQAQLAERLNCTQAFLSLCERGKRTIPPRHRKVLEQLLQDTHAHRRLLGSDQ